MNRSPRCVLLTATALLLATGATLTWNDTGDHPTIDSTLRTAAPESAAGASGVLTGSENRRERVEDDATRGAYHAPTGTSMSFAGRLETTARVTHLNGHSQDLRYQLDGVFRVVVAGRRPGQLIAHVSWQDPTVELSEHREVDVLESEIAAALAEGAYVLMDEDGTTRGYRFVTDGLDHRSWIRSSVDAMRFVIPDPELETWIVEECDVGGPARLTYRVTTTDGAAREIEKRKAGLNDDPSFAVDAAGAGQGRWNADEGWIERARYQETNCSTIPDVGSFEQACDAELELEESLRLSAAELEEFSAFDWDGPWAPVHGRDDARAMGAAQEQDLWQRELEGVAVRKLVLALSEIGDDHEGRLDLFQQLMWKLRLDPEALAEVQAMIEQGMLNELGLETALAAIAYSEHPAGESVLAKMAGETSSDPVLQRLALESLFHVGQATEASDAVAIAIANDASAPADLRDTGVLLTGALAHNAEGGRRLELLDSLRTLEEAAREDGDLATWLHALGNAGAPEITDRVLPELSNEDPQIREAAIDALRRVETGDATSALIERLQSDQRVGLRIRAASVLGDRQTPAARDALIERLTTESNADVRRALVTILGDRLQDELARQAIERTAREDTSAEVRQQATEVLSGGSQ